MTKPGSSFANEPSFLPLLPLSLSPSAAVSLSLSVWLKCALSFASLLVCADVFQ